MPVYRLRPSAFQLYLGFLAIIIGLFAFYEFSSTPRALIDHAKQTLRHDLLDDIQNSTLGFQKLFVINLETRTDHRDAMTLAGSVTGIHFDFMPGVTNVSPKAIPNGDARNRLNQGELGNWRAHMNVAQKMVEENIQSALILEDDVDWDLRLKKQMTDFAKASQLLLQPLPGTTDRFLDPTCPMPQSIDDQPINLYIDRDRTSKPTTSPYGDLERWDMLWIGHCGMFFPDYAKPRNRPIGRVVILDDPTVPEPQHIGFQFANETLIRDYPPHTRVVARASRNICTFGYALSLPGARRLLYELSVREVDEPTDIEMRRFCDGDGRPVANCLTVQPELFQHHRPVGLTEAFSDIGFHGSGENTEAFTRNIRWSTRLNMEKLMNGKTDYIDQYRDGEERVDPGWG